ncbi:MAG: DUF3800 domain-containing protein [Phycisphaerales bacterium]|nr:DUF3800 domain-containing protein [Phycisphaerales bacterium]
MTDHTRHFFVDEAGDLSLFNKRGAVLLGREGVSHTFAVGVTRLADPDAVSRSLDDLRQQLCLDPYFAGVPSMQPAAGKTHRHFHAKDDLPEVRREVFRHLLSLDFEVQVAIRRKRNMVDAARQAKKSGDRFSADDVYDDLIARLFKNLLHKADCNRIAFARRGKADRRVALERALEKSRKRFMEKWGIGSDSRIESVFAHPWQVSGLQVTDYALWALQRLIERQEDRYFNLISDRFRLVMDLDDTRNKPYGEWYSDHNPLTLEKIKPLVS